MRKLVLIALVLFIAAPAAAGDGTSRGGARLNAITSGRLYDRILTPQLNPSFSLDQRAEEQLFDDVRAGRTNLNVVPEEQRRYFELQMDMGR